MAQTSWGFDGTINEAQWAEMAGLLGNGYVAADASSCITTAVGGARKVSVSAGTLYGDGIVTVLDAAEEVTLTTPANGQWYVISLRREWAGNTTQLVAIAGATTTTTTPTAPPSTLPTLNADPGVLTDQPISWAWANSANTTVVVFDMRQFPVRRMPLTVANNVVRDGIFQTPTQGQQVWRNDLGAVETYFGAYDAITNPGGRNSGGWFSNDRAGGLIPVRPTTVTIASGSGSANALGVINFSGATGVSLNGVFSSEYRNYSINFQYTGTAVHGFRMRFRSNNTDSANTYFQAVAWKNVTGATGDYSIINGSFFEPGTGDANPLSGGKIELRNVFENTWTQGHFEFTGVISSQIATLSGNLIQALNAQYDGLTIFPSSGNFTGSIQVFGYND
jgi:hypothetical protein